MSVKCKKIDCFYVEECVAFMECEVYKFVESGNHTTVLGEVKHASIINGLFTVDGVLDTDKFQIINHLGSEYFAELKLFRV